MTPMEFLQSGKAYKKGVIMGKLLSFLKKLEKDLNKSSYIVLINPKSGTSTITKINKKIYYKRGKSVFSLSIDVFLNAFKEFKGRKI